MSIASNFEQTHFQIVECTGHEGIPSERYMRSVLALLHQVGKLQAVINVLVQMAKINNKQKGTGPIILWDVVAESHRQYEHLPVCQSD